MLTVYVSIGNSDDKLPQHRWSLFHALVAAALRHEAVRVHGAWLSPGADPWQNACWCVELQPEGIDRLKGELGRLAQEFDQDSIAWAEVAETQFLCADGRAGQMSV